jgi:hypothetical protein
MSKPYRVATALLCDDVRIEEGGKPMIIGISSPVIGFTKFPAKPRVWVVPIIDALEIGVYPLSFRIVNEAGEKVFEADGAFDADEILNGTVAPLGPFTIPLEGPGSFRLEAGSEGDFDIVQTWQTRLESPDQAAIKTTGDEEK